jgi:hypothetical protein
MRKIITILTIAVALSACNATKKATDFLKSKCADSSITKQEDGSYKVSVHCTDLYATDKVKQYLPVGKVEYNISEAELSITGISKDSVPDVMNILKQIAKGVKK